MAFSPEGFGVVAWVGHVQQHESLTDASHEAKVQLCMPSLDQTKLYHGINKGIYVAYHNVLLAVKIRTACLFVPLAIRADQFIQLPKMTAGF